MLHSSLNEKLRRRFFQYEIFLFRSVVEFDNKWTRLWLCGCRRCCEITSSLINKVWEDFEQEREINRWECFLVSRPNLLDSHLALILLTLIDAGFLEVRSKQNKIHRLKSLVVVFFFRLSLKLHQETIQFYQFVQHFFLQILFG